MEQTLTCCAGFKFYSNFDSANFARVEQITQEAPQQENVPNSKLDILSTFQFNVWTKPDCAGTPSENGNRTWFYFGIKAAMPGIFVRLNIIDINKQTKMYSQGMAPVFKVLPGKPMWERIRDKLSYTTSSDNVFSVSFKYRTPDNPDAVVYFAFTYPYSYTDLQNSLRLLDEKHLLAPSSNNDDIYYVRECVCKSIEGRRIDLLTISSYHNITGEREDRLRNLFPDRSVPRPFKFADKKVVFVSARVHPGETPSTFVLNGLVALLLARDDAVALALRRRYVFKVVPFLNPDGVSRGHYRTDTNGTNLNRVYLQPDLQRHPSIYAARSLLLYHHHGGRELPDAQPPPPTSPDDGTEGATPLSHCDTLRVDASNVEVVLDRDVSTLVENSIVTTDRRLSNMSLAELSQADAAAASATSSKEQQLTFYKRLHTAEDKDAAALQRLTALASRNDIYGAHASGDTSAAAADERPVESGLFLYIDMHGHASKKGIFMYGNHFEGAADNVECMLLPKIMSLNNHHFHFTACNFTERNMYLRDRRDGMSREGSGRVAVLKLTGLVRSYTLECNYNTGRMTNALAPTVREASAAAYAAATPPPPKYNPLVYEEVGRALGASILDLTGHNPLTRLPNSEFRSLGGLRQWLMSNCTPTAPTHRPVHPQRIHQFAQRTGDVKSTAQAAAVPLEVAAAAAAEAVVDGAAVLGSVPPTSKQGGKSTMAATSRYRQQQQRRRQHHHHHGNHVAAVKVRHCCRSGAPSITAAPSTSSAAQHRRRVTAAGAAMAAAVKQQQQQQQQQVVTKRAATMSAASSAPGNSRRLKLREICWIKGDTDNGQGKALIAKYTTIPAAPAAAAPSGGTAAPDGVAGNSGMEDNLVVSWDSNNANPQVYAQRATTSMMVKHSGCSSAVGAATATAVGAAATGAGSGSTRRPTFRVHNFRRRLHHHVLTVTSASTPLAQQRLILRQRRRCQRQTAARGQDKRRKLPKDAAAPSTAAAAKASTSSAISEPPPPPQLSQRLQRSKRKRKRNKSGLVRH